MTPAPMHKPSATWWERHPVQRVALLYLVLAAGTTLLAQLVPASARYLDPNLSAEAKTGWPLVVQATLSIVAAALLALPVAWVYVLTRAKKGYMQSLVQTLVLLPVTVAGVVILVRNSLALAFSLAGIVAAVRFRNALEDSKDAVYIFLVTGLGIAAAVSLPIALMVSLLFNVLVLLLWWTDFGLAPAVLDGEKGERRLQRLRQVANRTGSFVARLDAEILDSLSPEQLEAVAQRAVRRRGVVSPDTPTGSGLPVLPPMLLRVRTTAPADTHAALGRLLATLPIKSYEPVGERVVNGLTTLEYSVKLKKSAEPELVAEALLRALGTLATEVKFL